MQPYNLSRWTLTVWLRSLEVLVLEKAKLLGTLGAIALLSRWIDIIAAYSQCLTVSCHTNNPESGIRYHMWNIVTGRMIYLVWVQSPTKNMGNEKAGFRVPHKCSVALALYCASQDMPYLEHLFFSCRDKDKWVDLWYSQLIVLFIGFMVCQQNYTKSYWQITMAMAQGLVN